MGDRLRERRDLLMPFVDYRFQAVDIGRRLVPVPASAEFSSVSNFCDADTAAVDILESGPHAIAAGRGTVPKISTTRCSMESESEA